MAVSRALCVGIAALAAVAGCRKAEPPQQQPPAAPPPLAAAPAPMAAPAAPAAAAAPATPPSAPAAPSPPINVSMTTSAQAADPGGLKRFQGAEIISYQTTPYGQYTLAHSNSGAPGGAGFAKLETVEGAVTRIIYLVPTGHNALEVIRNYEMMLHADGFTETFSISPCTGLNWGGYFVNKVYYQNAGQSDANPNPFADSPSCYLTANGVSDGRTVTVAVLVNAHGGALTWRQPGGTTKPASIGDGQVLVGLDVIVSKPVANQMVTVKAADMADALASKGFVDLYGVYFDTDQTTVKPESDATLNEVATLLKIDRSLKLEVSGHTNNSGSAAHNLTLSQGRAQAVVQALLSKYGIDASRLTAKGYGDTRLVASNSTEEGKAKNRRVELRKT